MVHHVVICDPARRYVWRRRTQYPYRARLGEPRLRCRAGFRHPRVRPPSVSCGGRQPREPSEFPAAQRNSQQPFIWEDYGHPDRQPRNPARAETDILIRKGAPAMTKKLATLGLAALT